MQCPLLSGSAPRMTRTVDVPQANPTARGAGRVLQLRNRAEQSKHASDCASRSAGPVASFASPKRVLHALDNRVEDGAFLLRIDHGKAADQAPRTAEHHLLVEHFPVAFAGQNEPRSALRSIGNLILAVRLTRDVVLIRGRSE